MNAPNVFTRIADRLTGQDDHAALISVMAAVIPDDIEPTDELTIASYLSAARFLAKEIDPNLDEVIEKFRARRTLDRVLSGISGAFMFAGFIAAICVASLIPNCAWAASETIATADNWSASFVNGWAYAVAIILALAFVWLLWPKKLPDAEQIDQIERARRRQALQNALDQMERELIEQQDIDISRRYRNVEGAR